MPSPSRTWRAASTHTAASPASQRRAQSLASLQRGWRSQLGVLTIGGGSSSWQPNAGARSSSAPASVDRIAPSIARVRARTLASARRSAREPKQRGRAGTKVASKQQQSTPCSSRARGASVGERPVSLLVRLLASLALELLRLALGLHLLVVDDRADAVLHRADDLLDLALGALGGLGGLLLAPRPSSSLALPSASICSLPMSLPTPFLILPPISSAAPSPRLLRCSLSSPVRVPAGVQARCTGWSCTNQFIRIRAPTSHPTPTSEASCLDATMRRAIQRGASARSAAPGRAGSRRSRLRL